MGNKGATGISVIVPCYNVGEHIITCIHSILDQNFSEDPYEIILVDDCSTDPETLAALDELDGISEHLKILRHDTNKGPSAARNTALHNAKYKYILPIDADDFLSTDWQENADQQGYMQEAFHLLEDSDDLVIAYCGGKYIGSKQGNWELPPYSEKNILAGNMIPAYGMYRKDEAEQIEGYDEKLRGCEDWHFWISLINNRVSNGRPADVHKIETPHYHYRQYEDDRNLNSSHGISLAHFYRSAASANPELYNKHFPRILPSMVSRVIYDNVPKSIKSSPLIKKFVKAAKNIIDNTPLASPSSSQQENDITPK